MGCSVMFLRRTAKQDAEHYMGRHLGRLTPNADAAAIRAAAYNAVHEVLAQAGTDGPGTYRTALEAEVNRIMQARLANAPE